MGRRNDKNGRTGPDVDVLTPELMARVRQIQIRTHQMVSGALQGAYRSRLRGTGIEFEEVRPYQPGDEVRSIDWNVTARTGEPHIKTYIEERQLVVQLIVDASRSMDFGSTQKTKREVAAEVCALIAFVAAANQDQVGLTLFADETLLSLPPDGGHRHVLRVVREVMAVRARGRGRALEQVVEEEVRHLKKNALVMVLSDFLDGDSEAWSQSIARVGRRHDVVLARITDPFEEELPPVGPVLFRDLESGEVLEIDGRSRSVRTSWAREAKLRRERFEEAAKSARADRVEFRTDGDVADPLVRLFHRRATHGSRRA